MADGTITFSTALDNGQLEKDIKRAGKEIETLKRKIEEGKDEESFAKRQMEAAKRATEEARQAVEMLREELGAADEGKLAASLKDANREVASLEASMSKTEAGKSAIEGQMAAIRKTEQRLVALKALLEELEGVDPEDAWEWHGAQQEIGGVKQAIEEANATLGKQVEEQDALGAKWQGLDEKAGEYAAKLEKASARQAELAGKSSRLSEANAALKAQEQEQERLARKWRSTNDQAEKYTRQLERATARQAELGTEYAHTYSKAGAAVSAGMEKARVGVDAFASRINTMIKRVFVFGVILKAVRSIARALTGALAENDRFSASWENLKATVVGVANAIANLVAPALTGMVNAATAAIQTLAQTVDNIFGTNIMQAIQAARSAAEANWRQTDASKAAQKALDRQAKAAKGLAREEEKAKKTLLSFDEINAMQAETAEDAADGLDDEAEGLADPASLMKPDWGSFDVGKIDATLAEIMLILGAALMAVGAILCFSGINIPLGITLMVIGALMVYTAYQEQWDKLPAEVRATIVTLLEIVGAALIVIGVILCLTGNVPLGVGFIVAGAMLFATAVALDWENLRNNVDGALNALGLIVGTMIAIIGVVLCLTGHIPLGIAAIVAGIAIFAIAARDVNWDDMPPRVKTLLDTLVELIRPALVVLGVVLCLTGHIPLGIAAIVAGIALFAIKDANVNWEDLPARITGFLKDNEKAIIGVGASLVAIGLLLCLAAVFPLGIGCIVAGGSALAAEAAVNWNDLPGKITGFFRDSAQAIVGVGIALVVIGILLCLAAVFPLGIGCIVAGGSALAATIAANWNELPQRITGFLQAMTPYLVGIGAGLVVLGIILCCVGVIPLGVGCIVAGIGAFVTAIAVNWNFIVDKVKEIWSRITSFYNSHIRPIFTQEWWANRFKSIVNGLIRQINNALSAFGGFINSLANGVCDILNFFGVSGWSFSIGMPQIPYLAQGAVIPPNREFMAVLGDQRHGNNIETPESLMRQIVREETGPLLADVVAALVNANQGGRAQDVVLVVGRKELARETIRGVQELRETGELGMSGLAFS